MRFPAIAAIFLALAVALTGCGGEDSGSGTTSTSQSSPDQSGSNVDLAEEQFDVTWQDALDKANEEFVGDVTKIELEPDDAGDYVYKIELRSDTEESAIQIDANSAEVVDKKTDSLDEDESSSARLEERIDLDTVISLDDAMDAALDVQDGPVVKWKLEGESGGAQYEFDIGTSGGEDREVQIDAESGDVIQDED